jgi:hypothetical protein
MLVPCADATETYCMVRTLGPMQILASKIPRKVSSLAGELASITVHNNQVPGQATSSGSSPVKVQGLTVGEYMPSIVLQNQ